MEASAPLYAATQGMLALQALDDQLAGLGKRRAALEAEAKAHEAAAKARLDERAALEVAKAARLKRQRQMEQEIKAKDAELKKLEAKGREVRGAEAVAALGHEVEALRRALSAQEDELLALLDAEGPAQERELDQAVRLEGAAKDEAAARAGALEKIAALEAEAGGLEQAKAAALAALGAEHGGTYTRFLKANKGHVIRAVTGELCGHCKVKVPAHQIADARKGRAFQYCNSCGVILAVTA